MSPAPDRPSEAEASAPARAFRHTRRVAFAETDMAGVVHFSCYLKYMEEAEHAMWRDAGLSIVPDDAEIGFPRVAASVEYHAPLRFEDVFQVDVRIEKLSRRSITYAFVVSRGETRIATGAVTAVCVRHGPEMRAIDIPAAIVRRLSPATAAS
jgi:YbgC/YbaW family acyl-CoA thioester hydrolase